FGTIKRPQGDVPDVLREIRNRFPVREAMLVNTCQRFEVYAGLKDNLDDQTVAAVANGISQLIAGEAASPPPINVLRGRQAWHHLASWSSAARRLRAASCTRWPKSITCPIAN